MVTHTGIDYYKKMPIIDFLNTAQAVSDTINEHQKGE